MKYEILEHTADVGFRATGESLDEAFETATEAFTEIVTYDEVPEAEGEIEVSAGADDFEAVLFDYLDRLIYTQDVEGVVVVGAKVEASDGPPRIEADLDVAPVEGGAYMDIKAPTYNGMVVKKDEEGWTLEAVLDI